jgi:Na+(H+)/acetate symporter ActP|tara:strand:- start:40532 stop:40753 length:222 start_codon:yes stop_codon:yes gene_type:complete
MDAITWARIAEGEITIVAIIAGVAMVSILMGVAHAMMKTKEREKSRRELAAYVAEGSMSPADAERLLKAEPEE